MCGLSGVWTVCAVRGLWIVQGVDCGLCGLCRLFRVSAVSRGCREHAKYSEKLERCRAIRESRVMSGCSRRCGSKWLSDLISTSPSIFPLISFFLSPCLGDSKDKSASEATPGADHFGCRSLWEGLREQGTDRSRVVAPATTRSTTKVHARTTTTMRDPREKEKEGVSPQRQFYPFKSLLLPPPPRHNVA